MVHNIVVLGGTSHPKFVDKVCEFLALPPASSVLSKFSSGETRCEIKDSIRGKDVYIVQSFGVGHPPSPEDGHGGKGDTVNDYFIELCIMISACKTGSAQRVTAVLPLFPYSRQPDLPYTKAGAPLKSRPSVVPSPLGVQQHQQSGSNGGAGGVPTNDYTFESVPATPAPMIPRTVGFGKNVDMARAMDMNRSSAVANDNGSGSVHGSNKAQQGAATGNTTWVNGASSPAATAAASSVHQQPNQYTTHDYENTVVGFQTQPGYKQWMAQAGSLVADLITCAGADRVVTCDLHESTYQGFFDIPVDNLYARPLLTNYIQHHIQNYKEAVIVSPDAGGAKRASAIADALGLNFALIHKERRPAFSPQAPSNPNETNPSSTPSPQPSQQPRPLTPPTTFKAATTMMLVGQVKDRVCILVDDLVDTANTITRAAKLLKREGATTVYALLTHGVFSGDAIQRINASSLDRIVVTDTVPQDKHKEKCKKLEVLDVSVLFAEAIRRVHFGESISMLFKDLN